MRGREFTDADNERSAGVVVIDRALARLEGLARDKGVAVGIVNALPVSVDRLALWAKSAESRGFVLVPITAVAVKAKAS